jgi:hypothetical protein
MKMRDLFPREVIQRMLAWLRSGWQQPPPGDRRDPYAWRPVPRRPQPKPRSSAVAVAEPDE